MTGRPWLAAYPEGVPATIDPEHYASLNELLEQSFVRYGDRPALENFGVSMTFAEFDTASRHLTAFLQSRDECQQGDRVAVMLPNLIQYPVVIAGLLRAGFTVVNVNPLYKARELEHQLRDSGARAIIVLENFASTVAEVLDDVPVELVIVSELGDHFPPLKRIATNFVIKHVKRLVRPWKIPNAVRYLDALRAGRELPYTEADVGPEDVAFLQYTGGTTGVAKGAMLTHRNIVSNVLQCVAWARPALDEGRERAATPLPLYHIFSLLANLFCFVELGGVNLLITNPRDLKSLITEFSRAPITYLTGVNTLFNALLHSPDFHRIDFSQLKVTMGGGMAVQRSVAEAWQRETGRPIVQGYGLTETSPIITANPLVGSTFNESVGVPLPSTEVSIRDDDGQPLGYDEVGEIFARGPQVMKGYWNDPQATADVMAEDGWLRTGDIGRMDESGFVYIEDRKKDVIIVSGFNVYPNELENVASMHEGVLEAAAVGFAHEDSGEAIRMFIVRKDPALTEKELMIFLRERLTGYKIPAEIIFRDELPKTNVGKVLRRALR
ncbi:MAG: AMP-binding protein [Gammaproteobacteria bacterium]|nr:AMP-binding protein [Gammaproteobacteria bacterium]MDH3506390.1 AMP-binding protein [Gammaproteobacteria bacterium]